MKKCLFLFLLVFSLHAQAGVNKYVNLFIGTSGDNGQVAPGAAVPFGMVNVCPDSNPRRHAGYDYAEKRISGISVNRLSGVGCNGAGGNLSVFPGTPDSILYIIKDSEKAFPGYYETLLNNGVKTELTATHNMAVERYTFPKNQEALLLVNFNSSYGPDSHCEFKILSDNQITGWVESKNVCDRGKYKLYFNLSINQPFTVRERDEKKILFSFTSGLKKPIEIRFALSPIDEQTAYKENILQQHKSFEKIKKEAAKVWDQKLSRISVKGEKEDEIIFYTSLYRTYLSPMDVTSFDGKYKATDNKVYEVSNFRYFSSWSLWDTFRTKFPLLVLTEPEVMRNIATSLLYLYRTGKKDWSTDFECVPTVRTEHAPILLLDAYRKGITDIDFRIGYDGLRKEMEVLPFNSPDQKLESVYDLWAMGQIAEIVDEKQDAKKYTQHAEQIFEQTWQKEFMKVTPDFEVMRNSGLYQGTRWQYRWAAPQYMDKIKKWVGEKQLIEQLDYFFEHNLYNPGNEPDIHVPFLYNYLGAPEKTRILVHHLLKNDFLQKYGGNSEFVKPYLGRIYKNHPEGYSPEMDEDDGTMGAWYVFGSMGIYPLLVGSSSYEITVPIFDKVILKLENGKKFTITRSKEVASGENVKQILLNRKELIGYSLKHSDILRGGTLKFK